MPYAFSTTQSTCVATFRIAGLQKAEGNAVFKFEPFVLHVQCRKIEDAQLLHSVAISSGFRNSGITVGKKGKIMMAVRSTHCLEVPLSHRGTVLVSEEYIEYLVQVANQKMEENEKRRERFYAGIVAALSAPENAGQLDENVSTPACVYVRRRRQKATKKEGGNGGITTHNDGESDLSFLMGTA
ncbi:tRNA wybutosine-synthesizing protein 3 homolog [Rhincodon typus]|uniref:tRNA wybutosine-synthesizing protein 3 homolog n=1 Tax=Rhincodon typus TaxID=259920 RepID=UPI00202E05D0|nr:tRNA wybutosine-synthesizing protein 3 homolog [Rhincodon typus]